MNLNGRRRSPASSPTLQHQIIDRESRVSSHVRSRNPCFPLGSHQILRHLLMRNVLHLCRLDYSNIQTFGLIRNDLSPKQT
jgi:hypothetical protein